MDKETVTEQIEDIADRLRETGVKENDFLAGVLYAVLASYTGHTIEGLYEHIKPFARQSLDDLKTFIGG